ncbi:TetR/AcrR family transcriptional regulator [Fictibacillus fluitans]|uniref:TetR/AcrR family transcriptional regulator n=1 Tax=Fictibacillus fluitans TaxID=3058422 RepID=A0ABT8HY73_9BACL|nr:TetR/AcrR family transcriptional regulator [Fictibacillus sp. NE201]MDN4525727.1 TetR/AcrR family transcriptional regulator [Fictibacillus sp. NE201]
MRRITPEERLKMRKVYVRKMMNEVRTQGFRAMTIPKIAKLMNISRASLYNYFSSKEDVIQEVIIVYTDYLEESKEFIQDQTRSYSVRLQKVFEQAVFSGYYTSDVFIKDLKESCPLLYEKKLQSHKENRQAVQKFYQDGITDGVFHSINPKILIMRDETALKTLLNTSFLQDVGISLEKALGDYFEAMYQLVVPGSVNEKHSIDHVVQPILDRLSVE